MLIVNVTIDLSPKTKLLTQLDWALSHQPGQDWHHFSLCTFAITQTDMLSIGISFPPLQEVALLSYRLLRGGPLIIWGEGW